MKKLFILFLLIFSFTMATETSWTDAKYKTVMIRTEVEFIDKKDGSYFESSNPIIGYTTGTVLPNGKVITSNINLNPSKETLTKLLEELVKKELRELEDSKDDPDGWYLLVYPMVKSQFDEGTLVANIKTYIQGENGSDVQLNLLDTLADKNLALFDGKDSTISPQFFSNILKTEYLRKDKPLHILGYKRKIEKENNLPVEAIDLFKTVVPLKIGKVTVNSLAPNTEISKIETFGGPVVDEQGNLIGIFANYLNGDKQKGYILAVDEIQDFLIKNKVQQIVVIPTKMELFKAYIEDNPIVLYGAIAGITLFIVLIITFVNLSKKKKKNQTLNDPEKNKRDTFKLDKKNALLSFQKGEIIQEMIIGEKPITIGRNNTCSIKYSLEKSPHVSNNHGKLFFDNNILYFEDYSTNGSYIVDSIGTKNKVHKSKITVLEGSEIYLGSSDTKFTIKNISTIGS